MESEDIWRLVLTGAIALVGALLLHEVQQGGRRRRLRREIKEQFELLALLDEHPEVAARIRRRVAVALEQYEPPVRADTASTSKRPFWLGMLAAGLVAAPVAFIVVELDLGWWALVLGAGLVAAVGGGVEGTLERRQQAQAQDEAVSKLEFADTVGLSDEVSTELKRET